MTGLVVAAVTLVVAAAVGLALRARDGRIRVSPTQPTQPTQQTQQAQPTQPTQQPQHRPAASTEPSDAPAPTDNGAEHDGDEADGDDEVGGAPLPAEVRGAVDPAADVTLVQISTTFCAPCRQTRALLSHVAERTDGLRHVDLDVTAKPEIARDLAVLRTPTTIAYTAGGAELLRVSGIPKPDSLLSALEPHLAATSRPTE